MKIIFLDIDGVLNYQAYLVNHSQTDNIDPNKIAILKELIAQTNSNIVITSSWRISQNMYKKLKCIFKNYDIKIYDQTINLHGQRGMEIKQYLQKHINISNFVILDDDIFSDYDSYLISHLVKTSFYQNGLTKEHIEIAKNILFEKNIKTKKYDN